MKSIAWNILDHLTGYILGAVGVGAVVVGYFHDALNVIKTLSNSPTTLGVSVVLIALSIIFGYYRGKPKKITVKIIEEPLVEIGPYKWKTTLFSDGNFKIENIPYCSKHEMVMYENWPLYFCPLYNECNCQISCNEIDATRKQAESIIESHIRKQKPHLK